MNRLYFDLTREQNPLLRLGAHGLWALLTHGVGSKYGDRYPEVEQSETLSWELTDTTITLHYESVDDLNRLMMSVLGDFRDGVAVPPGWSGDLSIPSAYPLSRFHSATVSYFAPDRAKGRRRAYSLGNGKNPGDDKKWASWRAAHPGRVLRSTIETCNKIKTDSDGNPIPYPVSFTPYEMSPANRLHLKANNSGIPNKMQEGMGSFHPALGKWNENAIDMPFEDLFLVSFSCASYVYTLSDEGKNFSDKKALPVGIGIDAPTFAEADELRRRWTALSDNPYLIRVWSNDHTALWMMSATLDLPDRTYQTLTCRGPGQFRPATVTHKTQFVYGLFRSQPMTRLAMGGVLAGLGSVSLRRIMSGGKKYRTTLHDVVLRNLERGDSWARGLDDLTRTNPELSRFQRRIFTYMADNLGDPMELEIIRQMNWNYNSLVRKFHDEDPNKDWDKARKRAQDFFKIHLSHAYSMGDIILGIQSIKDLHPNAPGLTEAQWEWVTNTAKADPDLVRGLLLAGRAYQNPKKAKGSDGPETDTSDDEDTDPDDTDTDTSLSQDY